jgi:hypothetical protein
MHYRNGREAKNGDKVVQFKTYNGQAVAFGQLQNAVAGNDFCNGEIVITGHGPQGPAIIIGACMCDCLHVDDVADIIEENGLGDRPSTEDNKTGKRPNHQDRVRAEKDALDGKIQKLSAFVDKDYFLNLKKEAQDLMLKQLNVMMQYSEILGSRIKMWDVEV